MKKNFLWWCAAMWVSMPAVALDGMRAQEIATCLPGEISTWGDGRDRPVVGRNVRLAYRHEGAPPWFDEAVVLGSVQRAAAAWSACGLTIEVISEAAAAINADTVVAVQWSEAEARGNFALADLGRRTLSLSASMFRLLAQRNPRHPAVQTLQMAVSHEMGHFLGLMAHSRRCVDVMSYYDNGRGESCHIRDGSSYKGQGEYRSMLPTACDIQRCRAVNGVDGKK